MKLGKVIIDQRKSGVIVGKSIDRSTIFKLRPIFAPKAIQNSLGKMNILDIFLASLDRSVMLNSGAIVTKMLAIPARKAIPRSVVIML